MKASVIKPTDSIQRVEKRKGTSLTPPPIQRRENKTGMPDQLKSGVESLSGIDMSDVKVHFNSSQPAQLQAHAFAQGNQIHLAPGQEKHLPHEAWHVVQQKQGRVQPTKQMKGKVNVNDDAGLEKEADVMGGKAVQMKQDQQLHVISSYCAPCNPVIQKIDVDWWKGKAYGVAKTVGGAIGETAGYIGGAAGAVTGALTEGFRTGKLSGALEGGIHGAHEGYAQPLKAVGTLAGAGLAYGYAAPVTWAGTALVAGVGALAGHQIGGMVENDSISRSESALGATIDRVNPTLAHRPFTNYPQSQTWKMLMDGRHHLGRGKYGFENEKGYMAALMNTYRHMLGTLGQELTADVYEQLHDMALHNVNDRRGDPMALGYRKSMYDGEAFGVDNDTWSQAGHAELIAKYNDKGNNPVGNSLAAHPDAMVLPNLAQRQMKLKPNAGTQSKRFASVVLGIYYQEIRQAVTQNDQLTAIAKCCQDLDQLHLFVDGNIRTIAFIVLNKLLLENGMDPVILHEPNIFDCKSVSELRAAIIAGQAKFRSVRG